MAFIKAVPELNLVLEIDESLIAEEREDVLLYGLEPYMELVEEMDLVADDLVGSLSPTGRILSALKGREDTAYYGGLFANMFYGFIFGLLVTFLVAFLMFKMHLGGI